VIKTSQEALLGDRTPEDVAKEWADYMTKAQQKHLKK
jgi:multiple sugar transport system substrate-binding protein